MTFMLFSLINHLKNYLIQKMLFNLIKEKSLNLLSKKIIFEIHIYQSCFFPLSLKMAIFSSSSLSFIFENLNLNYVF